MRFTSSTISPKKSVKLVKLMSVVMRFTSITDFVKLSPPPSPDPPPPDDKGRGGGETCNTRGPSKTRTTHKAHKLNGFTDARGGIREPHHPDFYVT